MYSTNTESFGLMKTMVNWSKVQVVFGAFLTEFLMLGPMKSMGVYFLAFQLELGASAKQASMALSIMFGTYFCTGPLVTVMCSLFGYKTTCLIGMAISTLGMCLSSISSSIEFIYVTSGICFGSGASMAIIPMYALVGQLFSDKRPLLNNIITLGSAVSSIPLNILAQVWIDAYGWRGSLLLMGGIVLNTLPAILFTVNGAERLDAKQKAARRKVFDSSLLKSFSFLLYCIACGLQIANVVLVSTYLIRYAQSQGIDSIAAAGLSSISGAVEIALKPLVGYLVSLKTIGPMRVNRSYILSVTAVLQSTAVLAIPFATDYLGIVMVVVAYAACTGLCGALPITVLSDLFGPEKLPTSLGICSLMVGAFSMASPPLVGIAVDATGTFSLPFFFSAGVSCMAGICFVIVYLCVSPTQVKEPVGVDAEGRVVESTETKTKT